ncbi:hypothetical protein K7I13_13930 [Brucepastera parasyntrophica]|uniref:hypothetical protein n=1 Tax=Brucepastera parasyntrophica TaxID=2880008 RepID=UPI00210EAB23|nr:hypothetical protein [Brucepastera parasyntrophica]ULQ59546.1 hypothetical protein K7I13_13930 [Brucepastera parasyntrophica]
MSADHGEIAMQKPISEYARYIKNLIPANIPGTYSLKPMFKTIAGEEKIRNGVIAFRDFLYVFCDRLISDGHLYAKPQKTKNPANYPFLHDVNHLLIDIGYYGKPAENDGSLLITEIPSFTDPKPKISASRQTECLRFLALCGFVFTGIDLEARTRTISEVQPAEISYPDNPILLTGLIALSVSAKELWVRFYNNADNLFRCDYRVLKAEDTDILDMLKDFLYPLPEKLQKFALELHRRYTDMGMTCITINDDAVHFAYSYIKNSRRTLSTRDIYQQRVWEFSLSMKYGYCLVVRSKKTDKYMDIIKTFPLPLRDKIIRGYGCDRKLRNEPCQGGCQGIRIPLDDSILPISRDIEIWLDNEMPDSLRK